ncbi:MAG: hypothetical protein ACOYOV_16555 [Bacteroidales bacterium]
MHNLYFYFDKFLDLTKSGFKDRIIGSGNLIIYLNKLKMTDCEINALSLTSEALGIDSETYLLGNLKVTTVMTYLNLINRSKYNRRRKKLYPFVEILNQTVADQKNLGEDLFIVDSNTVPI